MKSESARKTASSATTCEGWVDVDTALLLRACQSRTMNREGKMSATDAVSGEVDIGRARARRAGRGVDAWCDPKGIDGNELHGDEGLKPFCRRTGQPDDHGGEPAIRCAILASEGASAARLRLAPISSSSFSFSLRRTVIDAPFLLLRQRDGVERATPAASQMRDMATPCSFARAYSASIGSCSICYVILA